MGLDWERGRRRERDYLAVIRSIDGRISWFVTFKSLRIIW